MGDFKKEMLGIVKNSPKRLVLPEGEDIRVLKAAEMIIKERFTSELFVLGDPDQLKAKAASEGVSLKGVELLSPLHSKMLPDYTSKLYESRKNKGLTEEEAEKMMKDTVYFGAMMLHTAEVDSMVSGSMTPTAKTVRAALIVVKPREGIKTVSGSFVMIVPDCSYGRNGGFIYADSGVVPEPAPEQLADIAISSAETCRKLLRTKPIVALLSFSTLGSADSPSVLKVREAVSILKQRKVDFLFDGEMQFDAAVEPSVALAKAPNSIVAGKANVMVFPDLNCGNIGYKITQRLAKAEAYGPLLQGLSKPVNDLSRGATPEDIMIVSAITVAQAG
jgi:phosphate acetyltransferase